VKSEQVLHGFDFDNHHVIDDQVEAVPAVQTKPSIDNGDSSLAFDLASLGHQLVFKATLVR
jgi:hypothetical protein